MAKKLFKLTPIGALVGALKGKKKTAEPATATPETKGGPIVTPLGGTTLTPTADLLRRRAKQTGGQSSILSDKLGS